MKDKRMGKKKSKSGRGKERKHTRDLKVQC
jgi:hypothetical protein